MEALSRVDRKAVYGGRRTGLRDAAILVLLQAGMSRREISRTRANQVDQLESGDLVVRRQTGQRTDLLRLVRHQTAILLEYLEEQRAWNAPRFLFEGRVAGSALSTLRIKDIEARLRGGRG